jgi:hypothetical protein
MNYGVIYSISGDVTSIFNWLETNLVTADAAVVSLEMALYGGLINSRLSNDTSPLIIDRLDRLTRLLASAHIPIFVTTVVMRIPSYVSCRSRSENM